MIILPTARSVNLALRNPSKTVYGIVCVLHCDQCRRHFGL